MATTDATDPTRPVGTTPAPAPDAGTAGDPAPAAPPSGRRRRWVIAVWVGAALVIGAGGGVLVARSTDDDAARDADPTEVAVDPGDPGGEPTGEVADDPVAVPTTVDPVPDPVPAPVPDPGPVPAPGPVVSSITAPATFGCAPEAPGQPMNTQLTLHWSTEGAQSVSVAIDDPNGVFVSGLPATGSLVVPAPCAPDSNTYYVVAVAADGRTTTASTTTTGRP